MTKPIEQKILGELLAGEFKGIKANLVWISWPFFPLDEINNKKCGYLAWVNLKESFSIPNIYLDPDFAEELLNDSIILKEILRHELLHLETRLDDRDKEFKEIAKKRKILCAFRKEWFANDRRNNKKAII